MKSFQFNPWNFRITLEFDDLEKVKLHIDFNYNENHQEKIYSMGLLTIQRRLN